MASSKDPMGGKPYSSGVGQVAAKKIPTAQSTSVQSPIARLAAAVAKLPASASGGSRGANSSQLFLP